MYIMDIFTSLFIFIIVLFFYIHITSQWKKSEDLEIYEMDYSTNVHLQEVCDIRQPVLFEFQSHAPDFFRRMPAESLTLYGSHDIKVKDTNDYWKGDSPVDYIILSSQTFSNMMKTDTTGHYISENNDDLLEDSGMNHIYQTLDKHLKPDYAILSNYDYIIGSPKTCTPLRYHTNYRQFLCVNSGKIHIRMTPWKSSKYVHPIKDYENYEFRSPINVWNSHSAYASEMDKLRFLEFDVSAGNIIYIPPYWWYSIKFSEEPVTSICSFTYHSTMSCLANLPDLCTYYLQQQNITKKISKPMEPIMAPPPNIQSQPSVAQEKTIEEIVKETNDAIASPM